MAKMMISPAGLQLPTRREHNNSVKANEGSERNRSQTCYLNESESLDRLVWWGEVPDTTKTQYLSSSHASTEGR